MRWNKFTLKTRSEVEDIVISTLAEAGVEGVEIEDKVPLTEQDKQADVCRYSSRRTGR